MSPNNLTVGEDQPAIDKTKYQSKGDPLNSLTQFNFKNVMNEKTQKKDESKKETELGDLSSIIKSGVNDSTQNDF